MEERKFTLDDVRDYLENTGALREAELLLTGKASLGFIPTIRRKDTTTKDGDVNSRRRSDSLEKALPSMLDPKSSDDEKNMVRMDELEEFEKYMRKQENEHALRKNMMELHLKKFEEDYLSKLENLPRNSEDVNKGMALGEETINEDEEHEESGEDTVQKQKELTAEEKMNQRIQELAEQHAQEMVKNKLYELSAQKQIASLEGGKFTPNEFDVAQSLDKIRKAKEAATTNERQHEEISTEDDDAVNDDTRSTLLVDEDPEITERIMKLEKLKMELTTDKQNKYVESVKMSKDQKKPKIINDRTSASDFLDKWLEGGMNLPKEKGFEEALKGRSGKRSIEQDRDDLRESVERDREEEERKGRENEVISGMDSTLHSFLSELRNEVKELKQELAETKGDKFKGKRKGNNSDTSHYNQQQMPYGYPPFGSQPPPFAPNVAANPYFPSPYMGYPAPPMMQPQLPMNEEIERMNKMAEEMEKENAKFNVKSSEDVPGSGSSNNNDGYDSRYSRAHNRLERKHEQELRAIQIEIEYLKHKKMLDDLKIDIENDRMSREKELEHNQFLLDQKQQLQALKLKQALAKEQKILDLQGQYSHDDDGESMTGVRLLSGVGPQQIPLDLAKGCEVFIDGCSLANEHLKDIDAFRVAVGIFDSKGDSLSRLRASEWQEASNKLGSENMVIYLQNVVRRRADMENDFPKFPKILVELQVKSKVDMAKSIGWGVLNLTSPNDMNEVRGGADDYLSNDLWRVPLRPGVSDPKVDATMPFTFADGQPTSYVLLRVVEINDINMATSWSPVMNGYTTEKGVNKIYRLPGESRINDTSSIDMESLTDDGTFDNDAQGVKVPPMKLDNVAQQGKPTSRSSSRPSSMRSERDNSAHYVHGLDPVIEGKEDPPGMMPTGRISQRRRQDADMWVKGSSSSVEESWRYEAGDGIDVYIDKAMFLPDNCTISRVTVKNLSVDKELIGEINEQFAVETSLAHSPEYNLKVELREKVFNTASSLLIRIDTVDSSTMQTVAVGYSVLKLFCSKDRVQCIESNDHNTYIASGLYQVPIYPTKVPTDKELKENTFNGVPRIPCASLLVRVYPAPKSADGLSVLSKEDFDEKDWIHKKILIPAPEYSSGGYDGSACEPTTTELTSHAAKMAADGSNVTVDSIFSTVVSIFNARKPSFPPKPNASSKEDLLTWYKQIMAPSTSTFLDYSLCVPYSLEAGITISVEMLHNMPQGGLFSAKGVMFKAIYGLTPPGLYYKDPPLSEGSYFTTNENLDAPMDRPAWTDGVRVLKPQMLEEGLCLIVDVRTLRAEKPRDAKADPKIVVEPPQTRKSYWAILPLAKERSQEQGFIYVRAGNYQVPLIEGAVPTDILAKPVPIKEVFSRLQSNNKGTVLKLTSGASVLVRVQNPLLRDHFYKNSDSTWKSSINTRLLEQMVAAQAKTGGIRLDAFKFDPQKPSSYKSTASQLPSFEEKSKFLKIVNKKFSETTSIAYA